MDPKRIKTPESALRSLMDRCAKCETATGDALRTLARWGIEPTEQQCILQKLIEEGYIDNRRYAAAFVREKMNLSRWGRYKIEAALRMKRVDKEAIAEAMTQVEPDALQAKLEDQLRRKLRSVKAKNAYDLRGKLLRFGTSLGFDYSAVCEAIERITPDPEEEREE